MHEKAKWLKVGLFRLQISLIRQFFSFRRCHSIISHIISGLEKPTLKITLNNYWSGTQEDN